MKKLDGFGHEKPVEGFTNDWITPLWVIQSFNKLAMSGGGGFFDLDPCASKTQPHPCETRKWVERLAKHENGIALVFARVETALWQNIIFEYGSLFLFPARRISFMRPDGTTPKSSAGAPSAFIAFGDECAEALRHLHRTKALPGALFNAPELA